MTQSLVDQFLEMVRISSVSRQEGQFAAYARQVLEGMGFTVEFDTAGEKAGSDTGNLIATLPGNKAAEALTTASHKMAEQMYKQAAAAQAQAGAGCGGSFLLV